MLRPLRLCESGMIDPGKRPRDLRPATHRRRWQLSALLAAAVLVGLLAAWLSRGEFKGRYAVPDAGHEAAVPMATPTPTLATLPPPRAAPPVVTAPPAPSDEENDASDAAEDQQRIADAIENAARKALDRGEPVHWHKAGERGYVVVSDARDIDGRTCRNVSATIDGDDMQTQSTSHMWCQSDDDGEWQPVE